MRIETKFQFRWSDGRITGRFQRPGAINTVFLKESMVGAFTGT